MIENQNLVGLLKGISERENIKDYLLVIYGEFDQIIISSAIKLIERKLILSKFPANIITKTKVLCVEILQNITKHQQNHAQVSPYFIIGTNGPTLNILSGNIVTEKSREIISARLDEYGTVDKSVFRDYYRNAFKNSELTPDGSAGLGLLEIVYRSNQNVKYNMRNIDNGYYSFDLDVVVGQSAKAISA